MRKYLFFLIIFFCSAFHFVYAGSKMLTIEDIKIDKPLVTFTSKNVVVRVSAKEYSYTGYLYLEIIDTRGGAYLLREAKKISISNGETKNFIFRWYPVQEGRRKVRAYIKNVDSKTIYVNIKFGDDSVIGETPRELYFKKDGISVPKGKVEFGKKVTLKAEVSYTLAALSYASTGRKARVLCQIFNDKEKVEYRKYKDLGRVWVKQTKTAKFTWTPKVAGGKRIALYLYGWGMDRKGSTHWNLEDYFEREVYVLKDIDLQLKELEIPEDIYISVPTEISVVARNKSSQYKCRAVISFSVDGKVIKTKEIYLESKEEKQVSFKWTPSQLGSHTIRVKVSLPESYKKSKDHNTKNNTKTKKINVKEQDVDLAVTKLKMQGPQPHYYVGEKIPMEVFIENRSKTKIDLMAESWIYVSLKGRDTNVGPAARKFVIKPDEKVVKEFNWTPKDKGLYEIAGIVVRREGSEPKRNRDNNKKKAEIEVYQKVDLEISRIEPQEKIFVGEKAKIKTYYKNNSEANSSFKIKIEIFNSEEKKIFEETKEAKISPKKEKTFVVFWKPQDVGEYKIVSHIEPTGYNEEERESDNKKERPVSVGYPEIDLSVERIQTSGGTFAGENIEILTTVKNNDHKRNIKDAILTIKIDGEEWQKIKVDLKAKKKKEISTIWKTQKSGRVKIEAEISLPPGYTDPSKENNKKEKKVWIGGQLADLYVKEIKIEEVKKLHREQKTEIVNVNTPYTVSVLLGNNEKKGAGGTLVVKIDDELKEEKEIKGLRYGKPQRHKFSWTPQKEGKVKIEAEIIPAEGITDTYKASNYKEKEVMVVKVAEGLYLPQEKVAFTVCGTPVKEAEVARFTENDLAAGGMIFSIKKPQNAESANMYFKFMDEEELKKMSMEDKGTYFRYVYYPKERQSFEVMFDFLIREEITQKTYIEKYQPHSRIVYVGKNPQEEIKNTLKQLQKAYESGNKNVFLSFFSSPFPEYIKLTRAIQQDFYFYRNIDLFFRINSITFSNDFNSAIVNVYWQKRFMLPTGINYRDSANMAIKFVEEDGKWLIASMQGNTIFGSTLFATVDLQLILSNLSVQLQGLNLIISGIIIKNTGTKNAKNFEVKITYKSGGGTTLQITKTISFLRAGSQTTLRHTFSGVAFIPGVGDTLKVEIDPNKKLPELNTNNNVQTKNFPF